MEQNIIYCLFMWMIYWQSATFLCWEYEFQQEVQIRAQLYLDQGTNFPNLLKLCLNRQCTPIIIDSSNE